MSAKFEFTPSQEQAIHQSGTNLLVSASAGSGKTRVLVQRVIERLKTGVGIDQFLIVTFTKAAAAEMRDRIQAALRQELAATQGNSKQQQFYLTQLNRLPIADITTMDAFCMRLLQRYYYVIDYDPVFRLQDETETALLRDDVWNDLREELYTAERTDDDQYQEGPFARLTANFSGDRRDDGLAELVQNVYNVSDATPDPDEWVAQLPQTYQLDNDKLTASHFYQTQVRPVIVEQLTQVKADLTSFQQEAETSGFNDQADYVGYFLPALTKLIQAAGEADWNDLRDQIRGFRWQNLEAKSKNMPSVSKKDESYDQFDALKKRYYESAKARLAKLGKTYFLQPESGVRQTMHEAGELVSELAKVVTAFRHAYLQEKLRRHVLDFADVEHAALEILTQDTAESKRVRTQLRDQYAEVMTDEYQDTNGLQEAILATIAQPAPHGNRFIVGDVKQSIYRFRQADPTLFVAKSDQYGADDSSGQLITLAENFRSMANIDHFTNLIFKQLMNRQLGEIDYTGDAELKFGATYYPDDVTSPAELLVYLSDEPDQETDDNEAMDETFQVNDKAQGQVLMVGKKIQDLIAAQTPIYDRDAKTTRPMRYGDITLLTPTKTNNLIITDELRRLDIPVVVNDAQSYFKTTEIQIMMSLLKIIDNPYQDIPLAAVLRSPIVGLNENELALLRINQRTGDYFQAVQHFHDTVNADRTGDMQAAVYQKIDRFLNQLGEFRDIAQQNQLVTLIWRIYQETGFLDYVGGMPAGAQRQANLHALYERAQSYEHSSFKGLFQFVRFVERLQDRDKDLANASVESNTNAVSVMTIHKSKGLEFPVVFLMDAAHHYNDKDQQGTAVLSGKTGIGIDYLDPATRIRTPSLPKLLGAQAIKRASIAEEMRKLYVALTRAESRLYIVGTAASRDKALADWGQAFQSDDLVLPATLREKKNLATYMDWLGMCLLRTPQAQHLDLGLEDHEALGALAGDPTQFAITFVTPADLAATEPQTVAPTDWYDQAQAAADQVTADQVDGAALTKLMTFQYPHQAATVTTAYQSVSEAKRLFEEPDTARMSAGQAPTSGGLRYVSHDFARPNFMQTVRAPLPTDIGTATHLVLQQLDVTVLPTADRIQTLIDRLVQGKVLTAEVAQRLDPQAILQFYDSAVGQQILAHPDQLHREVPFSLLMPAKSLFRDFQEKESQVLVHGIVDGYLTTAEGIVLFDYKTDHVNLENQAASVAKIVDKYSGQVNLYAAALHQITGQPVVHQYLYLLALGELVAVPVKMIQGADD